MLDHFQVPRIGSFGSPIGDSAQIGHFSEQDHLRDDDPLALHVGRFDDISR